MKLTKLYSVFLACFDGVCQRVVCAMRSLGSMPSECMNHARPQGEHTRLSAYGQCSKRDRRKPKKSRALTNYNAANFIHAAKRLSVALSPATRPSYQKAHAKRVKSFTMRADVESAFVSVSNTDKSIPLNRFMDGICSNCLFSFYCDDKDKQCLSVNFVDYEKKC